MKKNTTLWAASLVAALSLSGCASTADTIPEATGDIPVETFTIATTHPAMDASVALGLENPIDYLAPEHSDYVAGVIEGTITDVEYTVVTTQEGEDDTFELSITHSIMTVEVARSSNSGIAGTVTVVTNGAYLPAGEGPVDGSASNPESGATVDMYPTIGGGKPPVTGEKVVLVLTKAEGVMAPLADYLVVGSTCGRFVQGADGVYVRVDHETGTRVTLSDAFFDAAFS